MERSLWFTDKWCVSSFNFSEETRAGLKRAFEDCLKPFGGIVEG